MTFGIGYDEGFKCGERAGVMRAVAVMRIAVDGGHAEMRAALEMLVTMQETEAHLRWLEIGEPEMPRPADAQPTQDEIDDFFDDPAVIAPSVGRPRVETTGFFYEADCVYLGGNEDPSKCNSSHCPRHGTTEPTVNERLAAAAGAIDTQTGKRTPLPATSDGHPRAERDRQIWEARKAGETVEQIGERFDLRREKIEQICTLARAKEQGQAECECGARVIHEPPCPFADPVELRLYADSLRLDWMDEHPERVEDVFADGIRNTDRNVRESIDALMQEDPATRPRPSEATKVEADATDRDHRRVNDLLERWRVDSAFCFMVRGQLAKLLAEVRAEAIADAAKHLTEEWDHGSIGRSASDSVMRALWPRTTSPKETPR